ncbi:MAG TPA: hypothetical protein PLN52_01165 [Opitutaceae bacterium]|nr:hypothetical protein [Opitutaceae bacterium]
MHRHLCLRFGLVLFLAAPLFGREGGQLNSQSVETKAVTRKASLLSPRLAKIVATSFPKYEPPKTEIDAKGDGAVGADDAVLMAPFFVRDDREELWGRMMMARLEEDKQRAAAEAFSWERGGTILEKGPMKIQLKYSPERGGFDLLSFRW